MSNILQFAQGGGKLRYQDFKTSGTFEPSAKLLADGGVVRIILVGGGGAGTSGAAGGYRGLGGQLVDTLVTVTGPVTVNIGGSGGNSTFGTITAQAGGHSGQTSPPRHHHSDAGAVGYGMCGSGGSNGQFGANGGGQGAVYNGANGGAGLPNTGGGGGAGAGDASFGDRAGGPGGTGFCRVMWWE